jgi:hypothetical protein
VAGRREWCYAATASGSLHLTMITSGGEQAVLAWSPKDGNGVTWRPATVVYVREFVNGFFYIVR